MSPEVVKAWMDIVAEGIGLAFIVVLSICIVVLVRHMIKNS